MLWREIISAFDSGNTTPRNLRGNKPIAQSVSVRYDKGIKGNDTGQTLMPRDLLARVNQGQLKTGWRLPVGNRQQGGGRRACRGEAHLLGEVSIKSSRGWSGAVFPPLYLSLSNSQH